ncbi:hypothetical protein DFH29DRAFT_1002957 [Suillus ampliporus]|nr:hypothetical protein DFH29DRAFT_1002957 [Suillus ampliporus]
MKRARRKLRPVVNDRVHVGADDGQIIGVAGDHRIRGFLPHADGLGSVSSYALSRPNSIVTSSDVRGIPDHTGQKAKVSVASGWPKSSHIADARQPSHKGRVTKVPFSHTNQARLQRTNPPIAQAKPVSRLGKKKEKKKRGAFYKEIKKEIRGEAYWKKKAEEDKRLLDLAEGIWGKNVGRAAAEYRRRRVAKKRKGKPSVSRRWMEEKEGKNRQTRQKNQEQSQEFMELNRAYDDELKEARLRVEWRRELNEELEKSRREQTILKSVPMDPEETFSEIRLTWKEAKKVRRVKGW